MAYSNLIWLIYRLAIIGSCELTLLLEIGPLQTTGEA